MAEEKQDAQKTIVAFVVGLLIGGMLVWAFSGPADVKNDIDSDTTSEETATTTSDEVSDESMNDESAPVSLNVGEGKVDIQDQPASALISLDGAEYPISEGWIGVRDYTNEQLGMILGVVRFSESQGLVPSDIILQRPTTAGKTYAVVIYTEDGDREFNLAGDVQIDQIFSTFTAQ